MHCWLKFRKHDWTKYEIVDTSNLEWLPNYLLVWTRTCKKCSKLDAVVGSRWY